MDNKLCLPVFYFQNIIHVTNVIFTDLSFGSGTHSRSAPPTALSRWPEQPSIQSARGGNAHCSTYMCMMNTWKDKNKTRKDRDTNYDEFRNYFFPVARYLTVTLQDCMFE
jgi:hypothetical protein